MSRINFDCIFIIFNSTVEFFLLSKRKSSIMIKICFVWLNVYCICETCNSLIKVTFPVQTNSFIIVSICIFWINIDCFWIVLNCKIKLTYFIICETPVKKCFEMIWHYFKSLRVLDYSRFIVSSLSSFVSFGMELFCFLFHLGKILLVCIF